MLSLILPTFNEAQNLPSLIDVLDGVLRSVPHEIIIVDDNSPDGTWRVAQNLSERFPAVRVVRRIGKKGLSSAVVDGFDAAHGDVLAVMDADGQHDSALLLTLLHAIESGADIAIGSRYAPGGSVGDWVTDRRIISSIGTFFATSLSHVRVSDPLGGFFLLRSSVYETICDKIKPSGFKILLEILAHVPTTTRVREVPLIFRSRLHGESKLSLSVHLAFCGQVFRLSLQRIFQYLRHAAVPLFALTSLALFLVLLPRAWAMRSLYAYPALQAEVRSALNDTADHEGWLLSDILLTSVTTEHVDILHQLHTRTTSPPKQCTILLHPVTLTCIAE